MQKHWPNNNIGDAVRRIDAQPVLSPMSLALAALVADYVAVGSTHVQSLGIRRMPSGYALMLNADRTHYYYLAENGTESVEHWNKWSVWHWAMQAARHAAAPGPPSD